MTALSINVVLSPVFGASVLDGPVRVLDFSLSEVLVIELKEPLRKPRVMDLDEIIKSLDSGTIRFAIDKVPEFMLRDDSEISTSELAARDRSWSIISELVAGKTAGELFIDGNFGALVAKCAAKYELQRKHIYRLLYRYWAYGQSKNAFLRLTGSGAPGKTKIYKEGVIPGRPPRYRGVIKEAQDRAIRISEYDLVAIKSSFDLFANRQVASIEAAHITMCEEFYSEVLPTGERGEVIRGSHPTITQFRYYAKKYYDELKVLRARSGDIRWNKDNRALVGTAVDGILGPGHRYEIDSTIADVYLVHRVNRRWVIGRPVLYVVVDAYSRMIVGVHVSLEGPSWDSARHALYNAFTSKVEYCKRYGIDITDADWPCHHIPLEVAADRAECLSNAGETMTNTLGPTLQIAPPFRGDWKSIVESRFKLINQGLNLKFIPGGIDQRRLERIDRDYRLDATLDIDKFTKILLMMVMSHNKNLHLPHLATPEMVGDDIELTPISIWKWGMRNNIMKLSVKSELEIKLGLLPSEHASVRRGGIFFKGMLYTCELAEREKWAERSHNIRRMTRKVWYDPNSVENVWIREGGDFIRLNLTVSDQVKYAGYRLEEVEDWLAAIRTPSPNAQYEKLNDAAKLKRAIDQELKDAQELKSKTPPAGSKAEALSNIRGNRAAEVSVERAAESARLSTLSSGEVDTQKLNQRVTVKAPVSEKKKNILQFVKKSFEKGEVDENS